MPVAAHGGDLVAAALKEQGVRFLFTLCGGHISPILTGCHSLGIRVVDVRDEATAVFAADAVSRLTGVPGVAAVTARTDQYADGAKKRPHRTLCPGSSGAQRRPPCKDGVRCRRSTNCR